MMVRLRPPDSPSRTGRALELALSCLSRLSGLLPIVMFGVQLGCSRKPTTPVASEFKVEVRAESDDGNTLRGVEVFANHQLLGWTDDTGRLSLSLFGTEGQAVPIDWGCPGGHSAPPHGNAIRLTHTKSLSNGIPQPLKLDAICTRLTRAIVVVVHTDQASAIPVLVDGKIASITSSDGFAQVLLDVNRSIRSFEIGLDTNSRPNLRPKNPNRKYDLSTNDSILIFDQKFNVLQTARAISRKENRHIPYRVD